jgi:hypothetical protein
MNWGDLGRRYFVVRLSGQEGRGAKTSAAHLNAGD